MAKKNSCKEFYEKKISALLSIIDDERMMADLHVARAFEANALLAELLQFIEENDENLLDISKWVMLRQKIMQFITNKF